MRLRAVNGESSIACKDLDILFGQSTQKSLCMEVLKMKLLIFRQIQS